MTHTPELIEKLRAIAQEAAPYIKAGGGIVGHLEIALSKAAYAARDEEREACAVAAETVVTGTDNVSALEARGADKAAAAIRARSSA